MIQVADNFQYNGRKPLDARLVYNNIDEMKVVLEATIYDGILAYVKAEQKYYTYDSTNTVDPTLGKWRELETGGGSSSEDVAEGYFNPEDNLFYAESTYETAITGKSKTIYVALDTNKTYRFNGTIFVRLDEENSESIQTAVLPTASVDELGNIYQYTGADTATLAHGHFYECTTDGTIYEWIEIDVNDDENQIIQIDTLPSPVADIESRIYQFTGVTTSDYINGYFYQCIEDPDDAGTYIWVAKNVQAGGSGGGSLEKAITAAIDVGGIEAGDEFAVGTSYDDMWDALLNPTLYPTFTEPSASLTYSANTYYEVGTSIAATTATISLNRGEITPAYGTSGYRSGSATDYAIATSGADTEYSDSSASSASSESFALPALTRASKGTIVLTATISYAAGEQPKDSKGGDYQSPLPAGSVTASKTINFIQPYYYGKSATPTVSDFTELTKNVTAKGNKTFSFTTDNEHMVFAYDSSYGNLKNIVDPNGFDVTSGWTKSTLTVGGFSYFVYVADSKTTDTNAQFTFKY